MKFLFSSFFICLACACSAQYLIIPRSIEFTQKDFDLFKNKCHDESVDSSGFYIEVKDSAHNMTSLPMRTRGKSGFAYRQSLEIPCFLSQDSNPTMGLYIDPIYGAINPSTTRNLVVALFNNPQNNHVLMAAAANSAEMEKLKRLYPDFLYRFSNLDCPSHLGERVITWKDTGLKIEYSAYPVEKYNVKEGEGGVLQIKVTNTGTEKETYTVNVKFPGHVFSETAQTITLSPQQSSLLEYYSEKANLDKTGKVYITKDVAWRPDPTIFKYEGKWSDWIYLNKTGDSIQVHFEAFHVLPVSQH